MAGAQGGERAREEAPGRRGEAGEPHLAHDPAPLGLDVGLGHLDLGEDPGGVLGEQHPGVGEAHAPPVLREQPLPDLALQLGQLLGDGGGRDVQPVGRAADGAVPGDGVEGAEALQVQHVSDPKGRGRGSLTCPKGSSASTLSAMSPAAPPSVPAAPPSASSAGPSRPASRLLDWRVRFGALALVWGFSFLFIKVGTEASLPSRSPSDGSCSVRRCSPSPWS